jgi:chromosome partitioning protein
MTSRSIAVATQKGGSGKTTTAVNLAAALGDLGRRVLLVDLDPQASASAWLGHRDPEAGGRLLAALLEGSPLAPLAGPSSAPGVEVIAASGQLARAERLLAEAMAGETALRRLLTGFPADRWDYVLIDCPPSLGLLTINALAAAREVLVPVEASLMALSGLADLLRTVKTVQRLVNPDLTVCGIVAVRVVARTVLARDVMAALQRNFPASALGTVIRESVRLREAWGDSQPINLFAPGTSGSADYRSLAMEIEEVRLAAC